MKEKTIIIKVCLESSCYIKGAPKNDERFKKKIAENKLEDEITLVGSFCTGKCNRIGVTITVNDDVYTGITRETFTNFWNEHILPGI